VARPTSELRRFAVMGAEQRLLQISAEAKAIYRTFPEVRRRGRGMAPVGDGGYTSSPSSGGAADIPSPFGDGARAPRKGRGLGRPGKRRTMSADARRRISEAQKARWAKQRAEKSGGGKRK
jgi:hypothetical protein